MPPIPGSWSPPGWSVGATGCHTRVAWHPAVFITLTAPSFGPVHGVRAGASGGARRCDRPVRVASTPSYRRCVHGKPLWCNAIHDNHDHDVVGQPLCVQCYDYLGHVLFSWWAPELWRRFTIAVRRVLRSELRRRGDDPEAVAVSFVKVVELQARAIPHYHTVIRLDATPTERGEAVAAPQTSITATELAALAQIAAGQVRLTVADAGGGSRALRFGEQIDTQPLTAELTTAATDTTDAASAAARRVAGYLAKYVTKSVGEFGLSFSRISPQAVEVLDVCPHVRAILTTLVSLAASGARYAPMLAWLHTLGYRGHITTKSRRFSVTLAALRARREAWRAEHADHIPAGLLIGGPTTCRWYPPTVPTPTTCCRWGPNGRLRGWGMCASPIIIWPSRRRCGLASIGAWRVTPTAKT